MFDNLDDPRQQALLAAAFGLLGGQGGKGFGGFARDVGQAGLLGLNRYAVANEDKRRSGLVEDQQKMHAMQLAELQKNQDWQKAMQAGYRPGAPAQQTFAPTDMETPSQFTPAQPEGFDFAKAMAIDPLKTAQVRQQFNKAEAPIVLKADEIAYDRTGKQLFGNPKAKDQWELIPPDQLKALGLPTTGQGFQRNSVTKEIRAFGTMPPQVKVDVAGPMMEREESKGKAQLNMKDFEAMRLAKQGAIKENSLIDAMLRNPVETGKPVPITTTAKAWLTGLGITGDRFNEAVSNAQVFNAAAKEMVLNRQLLQKGPQTESDARRLEETVASLGNTPDANRAILAFSKAQNTRAIKQANFYDEYWRKNKTLEGADIAWEQGEGGKSIWESPELKKFQGAKVLRFDSQGNPL